MKGNLLDIWNAIDPIYYKFTRLRYVTDHEQKNTVFRVRLTRYKGNPVVLNDGTSIQKNDLLLKIHLHNAKMLKEINLVQNDLRRAVLIYHKVKYALTNLAHYVESHSKGEKIKGIIGLTSLSTGAKRLGFEVVPIRSRVYRLFKQCAFIFIHLFATKSRNNHPVYLFMSKEQLLAKYHQLI